MTVVEGLTTVVMRTGNVGMTAAAMCKAGAYIGLMDTVNGFMPHRQLSFHRPDHRASASFSHPSFFVPEWIAWHRPVSVQAEGLC
jgi:hypothetical protein